MKRTLLLLLTVLTIATTQAQLYNNEWIDYNKTYYKFKVGATGLYRIPQSLLSSMGLGDVNADYFQLWRNGEEVPIYTTTQGAALASGGYIEFWGEINDGKPDLPLYRDPDYQIADKWSLETDTAAFFLTVNSVSSNRRLMPTANVTTTSLSPEPYFMYTVGKYLKDKIHAGRAEIVGDSYTYSASYDMGEGYSSNDIAANVTFSYTFSGLQLYTGSDAPPPFIKINAAGNAVNARYFKIGLNGDSIFAQNMDYYDYVRSTIPVTIAQINKPSVIIQVTNKCSTGNVDRMVVAQTELTYPRQFNFGGATNFAFDLPASSVGNYLRITGFNRGSAIPVLYDLTNGKRYVTEIENPNIVKVVLEPSAVNQKLVLVSQATGINTVTNMQQRDFINYAVAANQGDYLIITNSVLTGATGGSDPVDNYRAYRSSPQGGAYNAKIYLIDQLIDQFGLGIKGHPLSIRNFLRWARVNYSIPLRSVFLIGKGVTYTQQRQYESNPDLNKLNLVPTFGDPASDNLLTAVGGSSIPLTPIGRISAISKDEVQAYLDKIKEYENLQQNVSSPLIDDMAWRKNVVHVTGASDEATTDVLEAANKGFQKIIEDTLYGAKVYEFTKRSSENVEQVSGNQLATLFSKGLSILTYFGHSSASTLEFNLDNPQNYNNPGKYPVMIVMGCNAGGFYSFNIARLSTKETISERYVLTPQRGAIAFLASTHLGIVHYLDIYNTRNYQAISYRKYGATIGEIMDDAINRTFATTSENDFYARFQCEEFTLHGDPAIRYYHFEKPDYAIEDQLVDVSPTFVSVAETSFKVKAEFMNLGKAISKNIVVELKRTLPDQTVLTQRDTIPGIRYMDSITYNIPVVATRDKGLNKITITVDADNDVDESYETNNSITKEVYIYEDELRPIYPYNYSIVKQQNIKLVASTANAFAETRNYLMEMDTTELFNSPAKITGNVTTPGGIVEFTPSVTFTDSTVYYWRVAPAATTGDIKWNAFSFQYISGSEDGFSQGHLYQHFKNSYSHLILDSTSRQFSFDSSHHDMFIRSGVFPSSFSQANGFAVNIDDSIKMNNVCGVSGLVINVIDPITLHPWLNAPAGSPGRYGSDAVCGSERQWNFQFNILDTNKRRKIVELLDLVPDGYYIVVRNISGTNPTTNTYANDWKNDASYLGTGNTIYDRLLSAGFTGIDSFYRPRCFVFVYKKNRAQSFQPRFSISDGIYDPLVMSVDLFAPNINGSMSSPVFGPAREWKQLHWRGKSLEQSVTDHAEISIYGINNAGIETPLFEHIDLNQQDFDISSINAIDYPYLRLQLHASDTVNVTPFQLKSWILTYDPVPEGAVAPNLYFSSKDTVEVGEPFNFGMAFKNISRTKFDSLKVKLTIRDKNNIENIIPIPRQKPLLSQDTLKLDVSVDTRSLSGKSTVFLNFNPDNDQPEQYLFNNYAFRDIYVKPDSLNPVMDVTFDGIHILNRDIVSAKPNIVIKLKDEAKWMSLSDSSLVTVNVKYPDNSIRRFNFLNNNDTLLFVPAGSPPSVDNTAQVDFNPYFIQDGEYELIVSGKDGSGNSAGAIDYRVSFQVFNKPMISNMLNYPNPFTTSTAFVFTITGSQVPQNLRIQILTITGKVVREITKDELGPLRIGRNITEFKWDGTDQYGQKLANGVYLYRVITNLNGKSLDKFKGEGDNTDKYFNNGYGKMYLMR